jgi:tetratricopeptide (TPR) repeat protein
VKLDALFVQVDKLVTEGEKE